ncbi:MAG: aspartate-semialdehyde dehydrogenase, partial [Sphingobacteriales bacterium]
MKLAIVGATGLVGQEILKVLEERKFKVDELILSASEHSVGKCCTFRDTTISLVHLHEAMEMRPDIVIFSAGSFVSKAFAPRFAEHGTTVIDNSSAWRMDPGKKLIVPEINAHLLTKHDKIIANPNCSTIQMVVALNKLHEAYKIKRIVVSTYQSVTGTGKKAIEQMEHERKGIKGPMAYPHQIDQNVIPQIDEFTENGYTKEEMKMVNETKKILGDDSISVTATAVRLPVMGGHSESVNVEFEKPFELKEIYETLYRTPGVEVIDTPHLNQYPMPLDARGKDAVFVGRIRRDESRENCLNMWIVADNLRKGAATNT